MELVDMPRLDRGGSSNPVQVQILSSALQLLLDKHVEVIAKTILDTRCDPSYGPPEAH